MKLTETAEDILEAIYVLGKVKKVVRVKDIAKQVNSKMASVVVALKSLAQKKLVIHEHYGYVELTPTGRQIAKQIYKRHQLLFKFFNEILGLPPEVAERDACRLEHYLSKEGLERIVQFIEFIEKCPAGSPTWLTNFSYFLQYGSYPQIQSKPEIPITTVSQCQPGDSGEIIKIGGSVQEKQDLFQKGFVPGATLTVVKKTPQGVEIKVDSKSITVNSQTAEQIYISSLKD